MSDSRFPTNDETILYIRGEEASLMVLLEQAREHFGDDIDLEKLSIGREHFHARCIGYDLYDSTDYDDYIYIRKD